MRINTVSGDKKLIYGDTSLSEGLGMTQDDIIIVPEVFKEPPELTIVCGEEQATALKGTYRAGDRSGLCRWWFFHRLYSKTFRG